MGAVDITRFDTFFLVVWIFLSVALLVLAAIKKLPIPHIIKGPQLLAFVFLGLQLLIWVFLLAALGRDQWSDVEFASSFTFFGITISVPVNMAGGLLKAHTPGAQDGSYYDVPAGATADLANAYRTAKAGGVFVLLFGLIGIFTSFALLIVATCAILNIAALRFLNSFVPVMANVQLIALQAMLFIWAVAVDNTFAQLYGTGSVKLGSSWALCFCDVIFATAAALFFAGGPGEGFNSQPVPVGATTVIAPSPGSPAVVILSPQVVVAQPQQVEGVAFVAAPQPVAYVAAPQPVGYVAAPQPAPVQAVDANGAPVTVVAIDPNAPVATS